MDLQKEWLESKLGHFIHQDIEGNYLLSEDDISAVANEFANPSEWLSTVVISASVCTSILALFVYLYDIPFVSG